MTLYRGPGGTGSATSDADTTLYQDFLNQTIAARDAALQAEINAELAETNAETAETNAETAETNAETAATNAASSASAAASSASSASTSASNASTSASAASTSATNAASSASSASSSASAASTSASNAATSETNAASSASSAATSATSAANSASTATTQATNAASSATAAASSASSASTSATNAANSASSASTSATNAANSATAAAASASEAAGYAASINPADLVHISGTETITGAKTFSQTITGSITGNAGTVTNGVYTTGDQTIAGTKTFSSNPVLSAGTVNGVAYLNGSKVLTTGSALTFDGTNLSTTGNMTVNGTNGYNVQVSGGNAYRMYATVNDLVFRSVTAGSDVMTLTYGGNVGIGTSSPSQLLHLAKSTASDVYTRYQNSNNSTFLVGVQGSSGDVLLLTSAAKPIRFFTNDTERMRLDSSGNLGLGVTPSAWDSSWKAFQIGTRAGFVSAGDSSSIISQNAQFNSGWKYISTAAAGLYVAAFNGQHQWFTAPSGTAGNAISFTQAMTLDASGNLLVAQTSANGSTSAKIQMQGSGNLTSTTVTKANMTGLGLSESSNTGNFGNGVWFNHGGLIAGIASARVTTGNWGTDLRFYTHFDTTSGLDETYERARIDSSGNLLVGTTTLNVIAANTTGCTIWGGGNAEFMAAKAGPTIELSRLSTTGVVQYFYFNSGNIAGNISINSASTVGYNQASDERLKKNIVDCGTATDHINAMRVRSFDWKSDDLHQDYGFVAQELYEVAPYAVYKPSNPDEMMAVDFSKIVPSLVKAIQEQQAIINQLKARLDAANL